MKLALEIPDAAEPFAEALTLVDREDCWDGLALAGRTLNGTANWEDLLEATETPWALLDGLLPDEVASQLAELAPAPRQRLLDHATDLLERAASLELSCAALDLGIERLAWAPPAPDELRAGLAARRAVLAALMPAAQRLGCRLCLTLRCPLPAVIADAAALSVRLLEEFGHPECRLLLHVVVDELPTLDPAAVLGPCRKWLHILRLRYEPALGVRLAGADQRRWHDDLAAHDFDGTVVLAPSLGSLDALRGELPRLATDLAQHWHAG